MIHAQKKVTSAPALPSPVFACPRPFEYAPPRSRYQNPEMKTGTRPCGSDRRCSTCCCGRSRRTGGCTGRRRGRQRRRRERSRKSTSQMRASSPWCTSFCRRPQTETGPRARPGSPPSASAPGDGSRMLCGGCEIKAAADAGVFFSCPCWF